MTSLGPLIVDFPTATRKISTHKTVRFSRTSTMKLVPYATKDENVDRWYSSQDESAFKRQVMKDVAKYSTILLQGIDYEDKLIHCVGISHLLSRDTLQKYRKTQKAKLNHKVTVLCVQELQRRHGVSRPVDLAAVSARSSRGANKRAHEVARIVGLL